VDLELPGALTDGDRLFNTTAGPWQLQTKMMWDFLRDFRYVVGFQRAAEVLGEHATRDRGDVDALAVPIVFCYRQWIELRLKDLWIQGSRLQDRSVEPIKTHDLRVLWRHVRPLIEDTWPEGDREELDRLQRILEELWAFDGPQGTGFRYAIDKKGRESLPNDLQINLHDVRVVMDKVSALLDGAAEGIAVMLEHQAEMHDEYRGDY
jgi:hypothetical protein